MKRPYLAFIALGLAFMGLAASGRGNPYYGIAVVFFVVAYVSKRRAATKK